MTTGSYETHETFFARIRPIFTPSEELKIRLSYIMAKAGHRNQYRKEVDSLGNPMRYFEHPRRVALILLDELGITDWEMIVTAFLHDGLEDIRGLTPEMIESYFNTNVCRMVKLLTKDPKEGYWEQLSKRGDWKTLTVKACDRLDNLRSLDVGEKEFQQRQIKETIESFFPLLDQLHDLDETKKVSTYLRNQIRSEVDELGRGLV